MCFIKTRLSNTFLPTRVQCVTPPWPSDTMHDMRSQIWVIIGSGDASLLLDILRLEWNGWHVTNNIFKAFFEDVSSCVLIEKSTKYDPQGLIDNKLSLVQLKWSTRIFKIFKPVFPNPMFVPWIKHDYSYQLYQHINPHSCKICVCKFLFSLWSLVN